MSDIDNDLSKNFIKDFQALRSKLEEYDELISNPQGEPVFDKEFLNLYGRLVRQICDFFNANTFHVFFQQESDPLLMEGVMTIRESKDNIRLQFIRLPIDPLTLAGYTFLKAKVVNVDNLYEPQAAHPELQPTRNQEIDRRLKQITREGISAPILNPKTQKPLGVILLCNQRDKTPFSLVYERAINAFSVIVYKSFCKGVFARLIPAIQTSGKGGFVTSLLSAQSGEDSSLSAEDILGSALAATPGESNTSAVTSKSIPKSNSVKMDLDLNINNVPSAPPNKAVVAIEKKQVMIASVEKPLPAKTPVKQESDKEPEEYDEDEDEEKNNDNQQQEETASAKTTAGITVVADLEKYMVLTEGEDKHYTSRYEYLVEQKFLDEKALKEVMTQANKDRRSADDVLEQKLKIPRAEIGKSLSLFYGLPYFPFSERFDRPQSLLGNLKHEYLEKQQWLPITAEAKPPHPIVVVTPDPIRAESSGSIGQMLPRPQFKLMVTTSAEFQLFFNHFFGGDQMNKMVAMLETAQAALEVEEVDSAQDSAITEDDLVKLVNRIISEAYTRRASDIHIEPYPGNQKTIVRFRIDGELIEFLKLASSLRSRIINRIKVMADLNISEQRIPQDGKIKMSRFMKTLDIELRVATYPVAGGLNLNLEDAVMRVLASGEPVPLEKLGIREHTKRKIITAIEKPYGLFFVCGPTGSGKTTTLHSLLKHLNRPERKIVTAEDPVEITQQGLRQMQVDKKAGSTFATAMRAFLRADPDVIMVGEMRDHETVATGIEASLTGHLVLSTLHTNSAPEAITRLLEMGMDPLNFADAMLGILAQRLAKRLCKECCQPYEANEEEVNILLDEYCRELRKTPAWSKDPEGERKKVLVQWLEKYGNNGKLVLKRPKGCVVCNEGYKGRVGLYELMSASDRIILAIKHKVELAELMAICLDEGMDTLKMDGIHKVLMGETDLKQVMIVCIK